MYNDNFWRFVHYVKDDTGRKKTTQNQLVNSSENNEVFRKSSKYLRDVKFISEMLAKAEVIKGRKIFKYFHLKGLHSPISMNEKLEYVKLKTNRKNLKKYAKGVLNILHLFLKKIKSLGFLNNQ